jgi:hypothetical protein
MKNNYKSEISIDKKYKKTKKGKQKINGGDPEPVLVNDPDPKPEPEPDIKVGDHIEVTLYNFQRDYELTKEENGKKYYKKRGDKNSKYLYLLEYDFYDDNKPILVDLPGDDPNKEQRLDLGTDKVKKIKENLDLSMKSALRVFMEHCSRTIKDENGKIVNVCDKSIEPLIDGTANLGTSQNPSQHRVTFGTDQIYILPSPSNETYPQDVRYVQQPQQQGPQVQYGQPQQYVQQPRQQGPQVQYVQQQQQQGPQVQYVQQLQQQGQYGQQEDTGVGFFGIQQSIFDNKYNTRQQPRVQSPQPQYAATQEYILQPRIVQSQPVVDISLYTAPMPLQPEDMTRNTAPLQMQPTIYMPQYTSSIQQLQSPHPVPGNPSPATLTQPYDQQIHPLRSFYPVHMDLPPPTNYDDNNIMVGGGKIKNKSKLLFRDLLNDPNSKYIKYMNTLYLKINNQLLSVNKLYEFINSKDVRVKEVKSKK